MRFRQLQCSHVSVAIFAVLFACRPSTGRSISTQYNELTSFRPGEIWLDTSGNPIRAHSGDVLIHQNTAYWYGSEGYPGGKATLNTKINVYTSPANDLMNWNYAGVAFTMPQTGLRCASPAPSGVPMSCYADRCHVLFNPTTQKFVMWCKSKPFASIATAATPTGPFELTALTLPGGHEVGDCTIYQDPVSPTTAVFVLSVHPSSYGFSSGDVRQLKLFNLSADWTTAEFVNDITPAWPEPNKYDGKLEAPALFYDAASGLYNLWTSHCTYWWPNDAYLLTSPDLRVIGHWHPSGNPTHNDTSFGTQSTAVLPILRRQKSTDDPDPSVPAIEAKWIYIADRFEPYISEGTTGRYVWLPIESKQNGSLSVNWYDEWRLG